MERKTLGYIFLGLVFAAAVGVVYWWQRPKISQLPPKNQTDCRSNPALGMPCSADDSSGWKTYTNAQYGFEFQYPAGHELHESDSNYYGIEHDIVFAIDDNLYQEMGYNDELTVSVKGGHGDPETYLKNVFGKQYTDNLAIGKIVKTTFAGRPAIIDNGSLGGFRDTYIYGKDGSYFILISPGNSNSLLNQILSTFKFIK